MTESKQYDIEDLESLAKLNGIQLSITKIEAKALTAKQRIPQLRGRVQASESLRTKILSIIAAKVDKLKAEGGDPATIRDWAEGAKAALKIVQDELKEAKSGVVRAEYDTDCLREMASSLASDWDVLAQKYARDERVRVLKEMDEEPEPEPEPEKPKAPAKKRRRRKTAKPKPKEG